MDSDALQRRERLFSLVHGQFGGDNDLVAEVIQRGTPGAKVSVRTIQAWLMPPGRASSRNCPAWALKALEEYVADAASLMQLEAKARRKEAAVGAPTSSIEWTDKVRREKAVEFATSEIEEDTRSLQRWQDLLGREAGRHFFDLERRLHATERNLSEAMSAIHQAVHGSSSFEQFKAGYIEHERAGRLQRLFVRDARRDIESSSLEFASEDAVLRPPSPDTGRA